MADNKRTEISELGEFGLIKVLTTNFPIQHKSTVKGVGDDAAILKLKDTVVVTTDLLIEGIHFDMMYTPLKHLGYKAVIVNLSDVYAMNAHPSQITVSLAISSRFSVEAIEELYEGIKHACITYNVDLIGGDTTSSNTGLIISVTAIGAQKEKKIVQRSTANEGDLICVSGDLGAAYLGLQLLEREKQLYLDNPEIQPSLDEQKYLVGRQLKPEARKDIIDIFEELEIVPTSMIDVSDGLSSDLLHICTESKVGARVFETDVPIHEETFNQALKFNIDPITCALSGGEDYELLFTIKPKDKEKLQGFLEVTHIGEITPKTDGIKLHTKGGNVHDITAQGWDALLKAQNKKVD